MKRSSVIAAVLFAGVLCAPSAFADGRKPGSKLVYPVHRSGAGMFTVVCVTNTNTAPATPVSFGGSTNLHFEYANVVANPADAFRPLGCVVFDRVEFLTPADTLCVLTACHNATSAEGQEGYLTITAQDPSATNMDWCFDHLIGSEMVINAAGAIYGINAMPLRCREAIYVMQPTAVMTMVGVRHEYLPSTLMCDSFLAVANSQLAIASLTDQPDHIRELYFEVWNDNEFALSATLRMNCWFDQPLTAVSPLFSEAFLTSTTHAPDELDINCDGLGDFETGWFRVSTRDITTPGGQSLGIAQGIRSDSGMCGAITAGPVTSIDCARLLWEPRNVPE
ncbi:MAG: hypothetical protein KDB80_04125 [Planctomycetes bacterium]|nr:hypothetical protein [Planctomycetota bacterium]